METREGGRYEDGIKGMEEGGRTREGGGEGDGEGEGEKDTG